MTLTIEIPSDVEAALEKAAEQTGQPVAELAAAMLVLATRADDPAVADLADRAARLSALNRIGAYDTRMRAGLGPLSNEAIRRESIY